VAPLTRVTSNLSQCYAQHAENRFMYGNDISQKGKKFVDEKKETKTDRN